MNERISIIEPYVPDGYVKTDQVLHGDLEFDSMSYYENSISPTILDPDAIDGYKEFSYDIMLDRLHDINQVAQLPEPIYRQIAKEINFEHRMRCEKNAERIFRLEAALQGYELLPAELAEIITRERIGTGSTFNAAELLSILPEVEGIEVMKATYPLNRAAMNDANNLYMKSMLRESFQYKGALQIPSDKGLLDTKEIDIDGDINTSRIKVVKSIEASITLNDVEMELVGRRSYVDLPNEFHSLPRRTKGGQTLSWYPIASSKYLRLKRERSDLSAV